MLEPFPYRTSAITSLFLSSPQPPEQAAIWANLTISLLCRYLNTKHLIIPNLQRLEALWEHLNHSASTNPTIEEIVDFLWRDISELKESDFSSTGPVMHHDNSKERSSRDEHFSSSTSCPKDNIAITPVDKIYAAHRILNENYDYFYRKDALYQLRTKDERSYVAHERELFNISSKDHLLFLLRCKKRIDDIKGRSSSFSKSKKEPRHLGLDQQQNKQSIGHQLKSEVMIDQLYDVMNGTARKGLPRSSNPFNEKNEITFLPPSMSQDIYVLKQLFTEQELEENDWWDPDGKDFERMCHLKKYALTKSRENSTSPIINNSVLKPLGYKSFASDAFVMLVDLGLFDEFDNIHQLTATHLDIHNYHSRHHSYHIHDRNQISHHTPKQEQGTQVEFDLFVVPCSQ